MIKDYITSSARLDFDKKEKLSNIKHKINHDASWIAVFMTVVIFFIIYHLQDYGVYINA